MCVFRDIEDLFFWLIEKREMIRKYYSQRAQDCWSMHLSNVRFLVISARMYSGPSDQGGHKASRLETLGGQGGPSTIILLIWREIWPDFCWTTSKTCFIKRSCITDCPPQVLRPSNGSGLYNCRTRTNLHMIKIVVFQNPSRPSVPRKLKSNIRYIIAKAAERKKGWRLGSEYFSPPPSGGTAMMWN